MIVTLCVALYLLIGGAVLDTKLRTAYLRPLTDKEMLMVVLTWPVWL
jgi:hypothetical protein